MNVNPHDAKYSAVSLYFEQEKCEQDQASQPANIGELMLNLSHDVLFQYARIRVYVFMGDGLTLKLSLLDGLGLHAYVCECVISLLRCLRRLY